MGFWSSFLGTSVAHAYRDVQKEKKDTQRWNDLDYELMMYAESFNEYLKRVGISCGYIYDVECVNNGNILPEKRKIDNMRKETEEYISLGGLGRFVDDIEEIDKHLEKIQYLRRVGQVDRQEEFAQYNLQQVKEIVERKQIQKENVEKNQKNSITFESAARSRSDVIYSGTHIVTNVQMWDYDTKKYYPCNIKLIYSEKKLEIHQDDSRMKKLLTTVPISENDYMNTMIYDCESDPSKKIVVIMDDAGTFVMDTQNALNFKDFYDKFDEDKDEFFGQKQDEISVMTKQISDIEKLAANLVRAVDDSKALLEHDAVIIMQRLWAYNKMRNIKLYDEDSLKNKKMLSHVELIGNYMDNMIEMIQENNSLNDKISSYICWEAIKLASVRFYSCKWEKIYGKYIDIPLSQNVSDKADGTLDRYIEKIIECNEISNNDKEMISIFTYYMMDKGYTKGQLYFPAYVDIMQKAFIVIRDNMKKKKVKEQLKGIVKNEEKHYSIDDVDLMNGNEFEHFVCKLYVAMGYKAEVTKQSGDQGLDVIAERNGIKVGIQAKCYSGTVGNSAVQEAVAGKSYYNCDKVVVITNNYFTPSAKELAQANDVILWERDILKEKIKELM